MKFFIKDFFSKCDVVTFTEEILNGKLHFLYSVRTDSDIWEARTGLWEVRTDIQEGRRDM